MAEIANKTTIYQEDNFFLLHHHQKSDTNDLISGKVIEKYMRLNYYG